MKKLISILFLIAFAVSMFAQEAARSYNLAGTNNLVDLTKTKNVSYATAHNLVFGTADSLEYYVIISNYEPGPMHFYAAFTLDTLAGADTTIVLQVLEKKTSTESYTQMIAPAISAEISAQTVVTATSLGTILATDTTGLQNYGTTKPNSLLRYRYLAFRLHITDQDYTGSGIKVKRVELQFF